MGSIKTEKETIHILTRNEVATLHTVISQNYDQFDDMDPVSPAGIKFEVLLQIAVDRQLVGSGKYFKYSNCFSNCASLIYGVINNHSFHKGNKRTGLLCIISCYTLHRCLSKGYMYFKSKQNCSLWYNDGALKRESVSVVLQLAHRT